MGVTATENLFYKDVEALQREFKRKAFDVIIIGSGTSGLTTASTLHERGLRCCILEAGPDHFLTGIQNTELRYSRTLTRKLRATTRYAPELSSGGSFGNNYSCLGGRSIFWNGSSPRFAASDFAGWPFGLGDLSDDYAWAESAFRVSRALGQTPLAEVIREKLSSTHDPEPCPFAFDAQSPPPHTSRSGVASALGPFFERCGSALADDEIVLSTGIQVTEILVEAGRAVGVRIEDGSGAKMELFAQSVVLAAGGIESIRLSALSDIPDPHGRIGVGLQEHIFYLARFHAHHLYDPEKPDTAAVFIRAASQHVHQWEIHAPGPHLLTVDALDDWSPSPTSAYRLMARAFVATEKRDSNRVECRKGDLGSAVVHFSHSDADEGAKAAILKDAVRLQRALGADIAEGQPAEDPGRFRAPGSSYHEAGGLDMGIDPSMSVTDPDGNFHTVAGLVNVDAAGFPRIGATNPHLTIKAVARRKARVLAERLKEST